MYRKVYISTIENPFLASKFAENYNFVGQKNFWTACKMLFWFKNAKIKF